MSERIYRALKKAKRRADDPCRFEGMSRVRVEQRGEDGIMVATDGKILARVDFPKTKFKRKLSDSGAFPNWEAEAIWPKGGASAVFDVRLLRRLLDIAEAVHPGVPLIRITVVDNQTATKIETADIRTGDRDPRFTGLIMPVTTEFSR